MTQERDKFLTEAMGECWHDSKDDWESCEKKCPILTMVDKDFSTWQGFGKLWEWAQEQEWFREFLNIMDVGDSVDHGDSFVFDLQSEFVHPDRFANAVYSFLKEQS